MGLSESRFLSKMTKKSQMRLQTTIYDLIRNFDIAIE